MKAAFYEGDRKITIGTSVPEQPSEGQVRLRVAYGGICGTDLHIFHGLMDARVRMPQIMGHEMSGTVDALGEGVTGFEIGDRVTVMPLDPCGDCPACRAGHSHICHTLKVLGVDLPGAFQAYWTVPARTLFHIPDDLSMAHGALIEPLAVACHDVRMAGVRPGDRVVVLGGGPIGILVALVARHAGADVMISEINPYRVGMAHSLGFMAQDPREASLVDAVMAWTDGAGADIVFEVTGSQSGAAVMTDLLRTRGTAVVVAIFGQAPRVDLFRFFLRELRLIGVRVYQAQDFEAAIALAASGDLPLDKLITSIRPLEGLLQGFEEMEKGGEIMKILLEV